MSPAVRKGIGLAGPAAVPAKSLSNEEALALVALRQLSSALADDASADEVESPAMDCDGPTWCDEFARYGPVDSVGCTASAARGLAPPSDCEYIEGPARSVHVVEHSGLVGLAVLEVVFPALLSA